MSATADRSVRHKFVWANVHTVYKTGNGHAEFLALINKPEVDKKWVAQAMSEPKESWITRLFKRFK